MEQQTKHTPLLPWSAYKQKGTIGHCSAAQIFDVTGKAIIMIEPTKNEEDANKLLDYVMSLSTTAAERDSLKQEVETLRAKCKYQETIIERHNGEEARQIMHIDTLKRVIDLQNALRKITAAWNGYSESSDEVPNGWIVDMANIAETSLEESTKIDYEFEMRKQVKEALSERDKLREEVERLKADLKYQEESFCSMTSNRTAFKFWKEKELELSKLKEENERLTIQLEQEIKVRDGLKGMYDFANKELFNSKKYISDLRDINKSLVEALNDVLAAFSHIGGIGRDAKKAATEKAKTAISQAKALNP